jgi:ABC-type transport system involved in multi-copper enzyme maturation permease subunit
VTDVVGRVRRGLGRVLPHRLLFGPIFLKETLSSGRRGITYWLRGGYAALLCLVTSLALLAATNDQPYGSSGVERLGTIAPIITRVVGIVQFIVLTHIGILLTASALSEEKLNRTIGSLFTTPMSSMEIVFGKLSSRIVQLIILGLVPLPILLALRVFGGIQAEAIFAFTTLSLSSAILAASIGLVMSAWVSKSWSAVTMGMLLTVAIYGLPWLLWGSLAQNWRNALNWTLIAEVLAHLSAPAALFATFLDWQVPSRIGIPLWATASVSNVLIAIGFTSFASVMMRRMASERSARKVRKKRKRGPDATREQSRVVGDRPVFWRQLRQPLMERRAVTWVMYIATALLLIWAYVEWGFDERTLHMLIIVPATILTLLSAALISTSIVPTERQARTWDVLMTTPLSAGEIVRGYWMASVLRLLPFPLIILAHLGVTLIIGPLVGVKTATTTPLFVLGPLLCYAGLLVATGLYFGVRCRRGIVASALNLGLWVGLWIGLPIIVAILSELIWGYLEDGALPLMLFGPSPLVIIVTAILGGLDITSERWHQLHEYEFPGQDLSLGGMTALVVISSAFAVAMTLLMHVLTIRRLRRMTMRRA